MIEFILALWFKSSDFVRKLWCVVEIIRVERPNRLLNSSFNTAAEHIDEHFCERIKEISVKPSNVEFYWCRAISKEFNQLTRIKIFICLVDTKRKCVMWVHYIPNGIANCTDTTHKLSGKYCYVGLICLQTKKENHPFKFMKCCFTDSRQLVPFSSWNVEKSFQIWYIVI